MSKQYITVRVEVDIYEDGDYPHHIESVYPVAVHTNTMSPEILRAVLDHLTHDDDADFDFMWELRGVLEKKEQVNGGLPSSGIPRSKG